MSYKIVFNPFTGNFDYVNKPQVGNADIPELMQDPANPTPESAWVLHSPVAGSPIGLLLALTHAVSKYQFSYQTANGGIKRTELT